MQNVLLHIESAARYQHHVLVMMEYCYLEIIPFINIYTHDEVVLLWYISLEVT
jgi:hypothetical protein